MWFRRESEVRQKGGVLDALRSHIHRHDFLPSRSVASRSKQNAFIATFLVISTFCYQLYRLA